MFIKGMFSWLFPEEEYDVEYDNMINNILKRSVCYEKYKESEKLGLVVINEGFGSSNTDEKYTDVIYYEYYNPKRSYPPELFNELFDVNYIKLYSDGSVKIGSEKRMRRKISKLTKSKLKYHFTLVNYNINKMLKDEESKLIRSVWENK